MTKPRDTQTNIAIACGGTGGHFFPGVAIAGQLAVRGCHVTLIISPKEVDQQAASAVRGMEVLTLPSVALSGGNLIGFARGFWKSYRGALRHFASRSPRAVLAMGGFTSAPPVLAGRRLGAAAFLHESNSYPGRANRWLAHFAQEVFVGFPCAKTRLLNQHVTVTGTPVRAEFEPHDACGCRVALGLDADLPLLLIMGGSQGATAVNQLVIGALPMLHAAAPELQFLHLSGQSDLAKVRQAYRDAGLRAIVRPFLTEMESALGAASVAVSRAGASSLAELAAMRVPAVLIPYPSAADNHQALNAREFERTGAARVLEQATATHQELVVTILELLRNSPARTSVQSALAQWHHPDAAGRIAERILAVAGAPSNALQAALPRAERRESAEQLAHA